MRTSKWYWLLIAIPTVILLQTLFFKFTGAAESVYIFTTTGMEPWGRFGSGFVELIASVLFFIPSKRWLGALMALGTMTGAIGSHLTILGIDVMGDGGLLFGLAVTVWICAAAILWIERNHIPFLSFRSPQSF